MRSCRDSIAAMAMRKECMGVIDLYGIGVRGSDEWFCTSGFNGCRLGTGTGMAGCMEASECV